MTPYSDVVGIFLECALSVLIGSDHIGMTMALDAKPSKLLYCFADAPEEKNESSKGSHDIT